MENIGVRKVTPVKDGIHLVTEIQQQTFLQPTCLNKEISKIK